MHVRPHLVFLGLALLFSLAACGEIQAEPPNSAVQETASTVSTDTPIHVPTLIKTIVDETATSEVVTPTVDVPTTTPTVEVATAVVVTVEPTEEMVAVEPTTEEMAETTVEPAPEETDWLAVEGKTGENLTYLGNPNAPVTIIDYSDFM
jgi:hypothetical protein